VSALRGHRQLDHTADLVLSFWAPTEAELLVEAARSLVEVLTDEAAVAAEQSRRVRIDALDPPDRLVRWLNEVLVLATVEGFLVADADLHLDEHGLDADVRGQAGALALVCTELKSVTYHDLELRRAEDRFVGRVVVDV
jgi:SHS2 domain-containing protein